EAVRTARVEHDRAHRRVGDDLLRPDDGVRLRAVAREHRGAGLERAAVDDDGEVEPTGGLEPGCDARGFEAGGGGDGHGATPFTGRASVSGKPSAMFADWMAAPAVPLVRLSTAATTTTRAAAASTVTL